MQNTARRAVGKINYIDSKIQIDSRTLLHVKNRFCLSGKSGFYNDIRFAYKGTDISNTFGKPKVLGGCGPGQERQPQRIFQDAAF